MRALAEAIAVCLAGGLAERLAARIGMVAMRGRVALHRVMLVRMIGVIDLMEGRRRLGRCRPLLLLQARQGGGRHPAQGQQQRQGHEQTESQELHRFQSSTLPPWTRGGASGSVHGVTMVLISASGGPNLVPTQARRKIACRYCAEPVATCPRQPTMHTSLSIIRGEHHALAAMLRSIQMLLAEHRRRNSLPDFGLLRAMLFYVDEFPERLHHTKESELLFPMLRNHTAEINDTLDRLDRDHAAGERAIRNVEHELLGFEMMAETAQGPERRERFEKAMNDYLAFYLEHMHLEEGVVLPLAERVLTPAEWLELDAAFELNRDPLAGHDPDGIYRPVFQKILGLLPAPLGLGPALA